MDILTSIIATVIILCILLLIRNHLVFIHRTRALSITSYNAKTAIDNDEDWFIHYDKYDSYGSYEAMILDLRKWTYRQFYPNL